jgi:hypothetical protein
VKLEVAVLAVKSPMVMALEGARALLEREQDWDMVGNSEYRLCPIQAIVRSANTLDLGMWWKLRLILRLRNALPAERRHWWPECVIHYNFDPTITHADVMAVFDRAIDAAR